MFFSKMFVVHFMCPSYSLEVAIVGIAKKFEPLVNKNIMHYKIGKTIYGDSQPDPKQKIKICLHAKEQTRYSGKSKNEKEEIVVFKKAI